MLVNVPTKKLISRKGEEMRKIYIDAGAYKGLTIKAFKNTDEYTPDFELYAFEPNHHAKVHRKPRGATVIQKAVWIEDGELPFYTNSKHKACQGATLLKEKDSGSLNKKKPFMVKTVDFGKWIVDNFKKTDLVIVKMDIEGAEFKVLRQMISDGSIQYVNKIYLETHGTHIGLGETAHQKLLDDLAEVKTLEVCDEFAHLTYKKNKCTTR